MDIGHLRSFVFLAGQVKKQRIKKKCKLVSKAGKAYTCFRLQKELGRDDDRHRAVMCIK